VFIPIALETLSLFTEAFGSHCIFGSAFGAMYDTIAY
jgi:hypothetical protein